MTVSTSHLCIGGPRAGQRMAVRGETFKVVVPHRLRLHPYDCKPPDEPSIATVEYRIQQLALDQDNHVRFWAPSTQSPMETMRLLLETYEQHHK